MGLIAATTVADAATIIAAAVAVFSIAGPLRALYNRTVGRRFDLYRRMERLGVGAHQSFFETVIGEGPAILRELVVELPDWSALIDAADAPPPMVTRTFTEALWVDPLFYAQTVCDENGAVLGFSITTRTRRFAPRFAAPRPVSTRAWLASSLTRGRRQMPALAHVRLGRTRFVAVPNQNTPGDPKVRCLLGARYYTYNEAWYFGNPGHYSDYVCSLSAASAVGGVPEGLQHLDWPEMTTQTRATRRAVPRTTLNWLSGLSESDRRRSSPPGR